MDGWMDGLISVSVWLVRCMYGWMDGRMDRWMDR